MRQIETQYTKTMRCNKSRNHREVYTKKKSPHKKDHSQIRNPKELGKELCQKEGKDKD